jgi:molybdate transport system ATP-binding protein
MKPPTPPASLPRLRVEVHKRLGSFELAAQVDVPLHGVTGVFGRSGAGKTTLIDLIAGRFRPDAGVIQVGSTVFFDAARRIELPIERRALGVVFQDARLFPHRTVEGNLMFGFRRAHDRKQGAQISRDAVVELLGLAPLLHRRPYALSGGERQRVALGRALLAQPQLLLMDEPLASLDQSRKDDVLPYIERLRDVTRIPILYVTHSADELLRLATALVVLDGGRVVGAGPIADVLARLEAMRAAGLDDAGSLVLGSIAAHDERYRLTHLDCGGFELVVPHLALPVGTAVRARIPARDVALATSEPRDLSMTNRVQGTIEAIRTDDGTYADVAVRVTPEAVITARLTCEAVARLQLAPAGAVWCLIKSVALTPAALAAAHGAALRDA